MSTRRIGESAPVFDLVEKAQKFGMRIWGPSKLESVLDRCLDPDAISVSQPFPLAPPSTTVTTTPPHKRSLTRLLESERLHGVTSERDPTQKRHDFHYFSHAHYFVLVEDIRGELATIAAFEFSSKGEPTWPVLHCHPHARGPFYPFDEKEKRRWERALMHERDQEKENQQRELQKQKQRQKRKALAELHASKGGDLRRSVSMVNLQWRTNNEDMIDLDADEYGPPELLDASGYFVSGAGAAYTAASGNSVGITSTTGTTSTTGLTSRTFQPLPSSLRGMIDNQVVTSRKATAGTGQGKDKTVAMGPPSVLPDRKNALLRKSKSTNTMKLPTREEGTKPGYCENCRMTFEDYKEVKTSLIARVHAAYFLSSICNAAGIGNMRRMKSILRSWIASSLGFSVLPAMGISRASRSNSISKLML
jgi:regulatory subunit for Cdc7p protein kinase